MNRRLHDFEDVVGVVHVVEVGRVIGDDDGDAVAVHRIQLVCSFLAFNREKHSKTF